jgi:hypothetical protein
VIESILAHFRTILVVGVVAVIVLGRVNRLAGSILSVAFWTLVAFLGSQIYARGGSVGFAGLAVPPVAFYTLCGVMIVLYLLGFRAARAARRRARWMSEQ